MSVISHYDGSASTYAGQVDSVYRHGVGDANPLVSVAVDGIRVAGNDVSPEMVRYAKTSMLAAVEQNSDQRLAVDKPDLFELSEIVKSFDYSDINFYWCNYHQPHPMISGQFDAPQNRAAQIAQEHEENWGVTFMCAAGAVETTKNS